LAGGQRGQRPTLAPARSTAARPLTEPQAGPACPRSFQPDRRCAALQEWGAGASAGAVLVVLEKEKQPEVRALAATATPRARNLTRLTSRHRDRSISAHQGLVRRLSRLAGEVRGAGQVPNRVPRQIQGYRCEFGPDFRTSITCRWNCIKARGNAGLITQSMTPTSELIHKRGHIQPTSVPRTFAQGGGKFDGRLDR
jgi:hypothetical protein